MSDDVLLRVSGLWAGYRSVGVLEDVSLDVERDQVVAVLGPNGAGKSTLLRTISGVIQPSRGSIRFDGAEIAGTPPHRIVRAGIAHAPEGRRMFPYLSTKVNLELGAFTRSDRDGVKEEVEEHLERWPVIGRRRNGMAGLLS